jgi:hypothetical protein
MLEVVEVVAELPGRLGIGARVAAAHLSPAGQAGLDEMAAAVVRQCSLQVLDERGLLGPRADDAHLAANDVEQLRNLVEVRAAQDAPDPGHAIVVA